MVGPSEARFSAFPPSPKRALQHLEDLASGTRVRHRSHNPLGAMMVYTIWATLLVIATTGILMANAETKSGDHYWAAPRQQEQYVEAARAPAADLDDDEEGGREEEEGPLVEVHEAAVNFLYVLIALHLAGVFFEVRRSGREIVIAMLPRRR
jgi:cytochrome b